MPCEREYPMPSWPVQIIKYFLFHKITQSLNIILLFFGFLNLKTMYILKSLILKTMYKLKSQCLHHDSQNILKIYLIHNLFLRFHKNSETFSQLCPKNSFFCPGNRYDTVVPLEKGMLYTDCDGYWIAANYYNFRNGFHNRVACLQVNCHMVVSADGGRALQPLKWPIASNHCLCREVLASSVN